MKEANAPWAFGQRKTFEKHQQLSDTCVRKTLNRGRTQASAVVAMTQALVPRSCQVFPQLAGIFNRVAPACASNAAGAAEVSSHGFLGCFADPADSETQTRQF